MRQLLTMFFSQNLRLTESSEQSILKRNTKNPMHSSNLIVLTECHSLGCLVLRISDPRRQRVFHKVEQHSSVVADKLMKSRILSWRCKFIIVPCFLKFYVEHSHEAYQPKSSKAKVLGSGTLFLFKINNILQNSYYNYP